MRQNLEPILEELHAELENAQDLDAEQLDMLRTAVAEIQSTLDQTDVSSATLAQRLQEATDQFSQSHPVLTNTIGRFADLLAQMGI
ncbi:DUF4404 family protein [Aureliella helgolandensis]|nr:DUF4404 family protein [Aureliella helgolandensis]